MDDEGDCPGCVEGKHPRGPSRVLRREGPNEKMDCGEDHEGAQVDEESLARRPGGWAARYVAARLCFERPLTVGGAEVVVEPSAPPATGGGPGINCHPADRIDLQVMPGTLSAHRPVDDHRVGDVPEMAGPGLFKLDAVWLAHFPPSVGGQEDLSRPSRSGDPGRQIHRAPEPVAVTSDCSTRVHPDPDRR